MANEKFSWEGSDSGIRRKAGWVGGWGQSHSAL